MDAEPSIVGEPINRFGFIYAPVNKEGVGTFFAKVAERLQMQIEEVRPSAPHCIARRQTTRGWEQVAIIYAYNSLDLQARTSALRGCDVLVCWHHSWLNCPLEVIELRTLRPQTTLSPDNDGEQRRLARYLGRQSTHTRRLFRHLDEGIRALASDIVAQTTKGRQGAGGVSYYAPELRFCRVDFRHTGRWLMLSVFTSGQLWRGIKPSVSEPWGGFSVGTEADLTRALGLAKAAYAARKRAVAAGGMQTWDEPQHHERVLELRPAGGEHDQGERRVPPWTVPPHPTPEMGQRSPQA
jgi:hypothetical protein